VRTDARYSGLLLTNGLILTDPDAPVVIPHGQTRISGERLLEVNVDIEAPSTDSVIIDCSGCLIMPGFVNAHNHAAMSLLRGVADDLPLERWLNDYIFPAEANHVSAEFVHLGTRLSAAEMVLSGTTTVADAYFFMGESAKAIAEVGL
jgi:5-methylthioadenosine/S-adenosylhomocysteine deaminase